MVFVVSFLNKTAYSIKMEHSLLKKQPVIMILSSSLLRSPKAFFS